MQKHYAKQMHFHSALFELLLDITIRPPKQFRRVLVCFAYNKLVKHILHTESNSLSSPVTASLSSRSSSTPAPPVNTPASPPSQPVSLPDNNSLAQAISRALAESLPPLLSFPRDSSGGNTNMPATFGPLSSASNSMPSLASWSSDASWSSGTPCSTAQSSATLAVPSFISTYSSFGGPSVVSTLPPCPPPTCL